MSLLEQHYGDRLPRRTKKRLLGRRLNKSTLRPLIAARIAFVRDYEAPKNSIAYTEQHMSMGVPCIRYAELLTNEFCPKCGCTVIIGTGNRADYPEHWEDFNCGRCGFCVGGIDNSPYGSWVERDYYDEVYHD